MRKTLLLVLLSVFISHAAYSQAIIDTFSQPVQNSLTNGELRGSVFDAKTKEPLQYATLYILQKHTGTVTNEKGGFLVSLSGLDKKDTVQFSYIGYKTMKRTIGTLEKFPAVYLTEEVFHLNEMVVFGRAPDPVSIVKNVVKNKEANYGKNPAVWRTFVRVRNTDDIHRLVISYKKGNIPELDQSMIAEAEKKIPQHTISYTDFLGNLYLPANKDDTLKIDPIRSVALKEKNGDEMKQLENIFRNLFTGTGQKEYWKMKSGIFGGKLELEKEDTLPAAKDTLDGNKVKTEYFDRMLNYYLKYPTLNDKKKWEFLYNTGRYKYTLAGGIRVNGEEVYVIDFVPDNSGKYEGRLYISSGSYALIRADYRYAPQKTGTDFHLLGVGYTENEFKGSVYFEKKKGHYVLKYFSEKEGVDVTFDRSLALLKKRKRFLFDKTLKEIKVGVDMEIRSETSIELLVLDRRPLTPEQFTGFKQKKEMNILYVDQFNDKLWKGFSIIEPTRQMREYKKQGENR